MPEISEEHVVRLEALADEIAAIAAAIRATGVEPTPAIEAVVREKLAQKICLHCGKLVKGARYVRGVHDTCRYQQQQWIKEGKTTEAALILAGRLTAQKGKSGRKPTYTVGDEEIEKINAVASGILPLKKDAPPENREGDEG